MLKAGEKCGRWTIIGQLEKGRHPRVMCRCDCGTERRVQTCHLTNGASTGCGCVRKAAMRLPSGKARKEERPGYNSWRGMRERCGKPNHISYPWYGAKGVRVCAAWQDSFDAFIADMGAPPEGKPWIERLDGARGYEPGNCVWASPKEQARNTSRNRLLTAGGKTLVAKDWADELGIPAPTIYGRLRRGLSGDDALAFAAEPMRDEGDSL